MRNLPRNMFPHQSCVLWHNSLIKECTKPISSNYHLSIPRPGPRMHFRSAATFLIKSVCHYQHHVTSQTQMRAYKHVCCRNTRYMMLFCILNFFLLEQYFLMFHSIFFFCENFYTTNGCTPSNY